MNTKNKPKNSFNIESKNFLIDYKNVDEVQRLIKKIQDKATRVTANLITREQDLIEKKEFSINASFMIKDLETRLMIKENELAQTKLEYDTFQKMEEIYEVDKEDIVEKKKELENLESIKFKKTKSLNNQKS